MEWSLGQWDGLWQDQAALNASSSHKTEGRACVDAGGGRNTGAGGGGGSTDSESVVNVLQILARPNSLCQSLSQSLSIKVFTN